MSPAKWSRSRLREHRALVGLVLLFLVLGSLYSVLTPIFEAGDEVWHYPFVQYLATTGQLPVQDPAQRTLWEQEGGQPPLYYALSAAATVWIDTRDLEQRLWRNPFARNIGVPLAFGNKNLVVHTSAEDFPWHNTTLAVHLIRFLSLLLSACTVVLTYLLAQELTPPGQNKTRDRAPALGAAALVALNPMFLFISASVNNDSLAAMLAALGLLLIVQLATRGPDRRRLFGLGLVAGLAALTKVSDLALLPLALLVAAWLSWRARDLALLLRAAALICLPALAVAGWWYARNFLLYGDPLAFNVWLKIAGGRATPVTLLGLVGEFQGFRISYWGNFGGVNLIAPDWVYTALDLISLLALVGLVIGAIRRRLPRGLWIPAAWLAVVVVSLIRWTLLTYASQGRLIFPAVSAVGVLLAFGLDQFTPYVSRVISQAAHLPDSLIPILPIPLLAPVLFLFALALASPFLIISPAYATPPRLSSEAAVPNPVHITFADEAQPELVGYEAARAVLPGGELPLTLYWRAAQPVSEDLYVYIHLFDSKGELIGQWDALPGNGLYPTAFWRPQEIIVDRYRVPVSSLASGQQVGRVEAGLTPVGSTIPLTAHDPNGVEIAPVLGRFKIASPRESADTRPVLFRFGDALELLGWSARAIRGNTEFQITSPRPGAVDTPLHGGDLMRIDFTLRAASVPPDDYTIFVHLVNAEGRIVAQRDVQPLGGAYPTSFWDAGETVTDEIAVAVPADAVPGQYAVEFGLYRAADDTRLSVSGGTAGDLRAIGDHLLLAPVDVGK